MNTKELYKFVDDEDLPDDLRRAFQRELKRQRQRRGNRADTDQTRVRIIPERGAVRRLGAAERPRR